MKKENGKTDITFGRAHCMKKALQCKKKRI